MPTHAFPCPWFLRFALILSVFGGLALRATAAQVQAQPDELERELEAERLEADRLRRRGETAKALRSLTTLLDDDGADVAARILRARVRVEEAEWDRARADLVRGLEDATRSGVAAVQVWIADGARQLAALELMQGRPAAAREVLSRHGAALNPATDTRDAWILARTAAALGEREPARLHLEQGAGGSEPASWEALLAKARCERALGSLEAASRSLIEADRLAAGGDGVEPDVLAELAAIYFEADGEIVHDEAQGRSPGELLKQALVLHPRHEAATLGLYELNRFNWNRQSRSPSDILSDWLRSRPASIEGLLAGASADLDDGQLVAARQRISRLESLAAGRRELRTLQAALAWIEHDGDRARSLLSKLAAEDAGDSRPEREVGRTLCELYRFTEGLDFLRRAVEIDPEDFEAWTQLGRAQANTGDEEGARASLAKATELAAGRQNAWRFNMSRVLERMHTTFTRLRAGDHTFLWAPDAAPVLQRYLVPFYAAARESLSARYGFTPGPVQIEVFERHRDFSVRSTGFEGFPALGVCFGPVVTAVSPVSELRGSFSWARTSFHEFTHVVHLGLSHNRCPRWITEGLATWEEVNREPSWTRNMRRELIDSRASGELIGVRDLNRAFRGPRILFAYYQSGLWCQMMIERHGFASMVQLLEAFDRGLDLDSALKQVFQATPEELDRRFEEFVDREIANLRIEPRWSAGRLVKLQLELATTAPSAPAARARWVEDTVSLAFGRWQNGAVVDAEQALRRIDAAGARSPRACFLRGEIAMAAGKRDLAQENWLEGLGLGGDDFLVRFALARLAQSAEDFALAEEHYLAAERCFPGFDEVRMSAELALAALYRRTDRPDDANAARSRWLRFDSGDYDQRMLVAQWHGEAGLWAEAERLYAEANDIDPFRRKLHGQWAESLVQLGRHEDALREYEVSALVRAELDADRPEPLTDSERAELLGLQAGCLVDLGRTEEAGARIEAALTLDPECASARAARSRLP